MPAVSTNKTGPKGSNSIDFSTGSVVVPAVSETIEISCLVKAFNMLDFPTFLLPKSPICAFIPFGMFCILSPFDIQTNPRPVSQKPANWPVAMHFAHIR